MMDMEWSKVSLYPAGYFSRGITFAPSVTLAHGWQLGTALETASQSGDTITFKPVTFNNLVDSPIYAGQYFKRVDLNSGRRRAGAPGHRRRRAEVPGDDARAVEGASRAGDAGGQAVRLAPLRPLRLPVLAVG